MNFTIERGFALEKNAQTEQGFTLIELLVTIAILGILASLSIASFILYKENAEYAKGTATLHNARTGLNASEMDLPEGYTLAYTESGTGGGDLSGALAQVLPGISLPPSVRVGVELAVCNESSNPMDREAYVVSEPCNSHEEVRWQKFCGGLEVLLEHVANASPCT